MGHAVLRSTPKPPKMRRCNGPTDRPMGGRTDGQTLLLRCFVAPKNILGRYRPMNEHSCPLPCKIDISLLITREQRLAQ